MVWSDPSSIMNHGHILLTVNALYDPAFYYTSQELHEKAVQELVEKPHIYVIARCRHITEDQLLYSETRLEDIRQLDVQVASAPKSLALRIYADFSMVTIPHKRSKLGSRLVVVMGVVDAVGLQQTSLIMWDP